VYDVIADYNTGHPSILPPEYFGRLDVLAGGHGAGTKIRFEMKAFGRTNVATGDVTEPVPGRELRETLTTGIVTTFLVEPVQPSESRVTINAPRSHHLGWIRLLAPRTCDGVRGGTGATRALRPAVGAMRRIEQSVVLMSSPRAVRPDAAAHRRRVRANAGTHPRSSRTPDQVSQIPWSASWRDLRDSRLRQS
jgi:hypothetical protein